MAWLMPVNRSLDAAIRRTSPNFSHNPPCRIGFVLSLNTYAWTPKANTAPIGVLVALAAWLFMWSLETSKMNTPFTSKTPGCSGSTASRIETPTAKPVGFSARRTSCLPWLLPVCRRPSLAPPLSAKLTVQQFVIFRTKTKKCLC
jgi:hypothetical protein